MKILYIADDHRAAEQAVRALRALSPEVEIALVSDQEEARRWITWNRDLAVLLLDVESDNPGWAEFVMHFRQQGVGARVVVASADASGRPTPLTMVADEVVAKDSLFPRNLPGIMAPAAAPAMPASTPRRRRLLYIGDAALARQSLGRSIEVIERVPEPDTPFQPLPAEGVDADSSFDIVLIEHGYPGVDSLAILQDIAGRQPALPAVVVAEWDDRLALSALKLGAFDYVVKSGPSFRAILFRFHRLIAYSTLLQEHASLREARTQPVPPADGGITTGEQAAREAALITRLAETKRALQRAEERLANEGGPADGRLAEAQARHDARVAELETAHRAALDAARLKERAQQQRLEEELSREAAKRQALETALADAEAAREETLRHHEAQLAAAAVHQATFETALEGTRAEIARLESGVLERASLEALRGSLENDLAGLRAEHQALQQILEQTRAAARSAIEQAATEHAAERARLDALIAERDVQLRDAEARLRNSENAAVRALAESRVAGEATDRRHREELAAMVARHDSQLAELTAGHRAAFEAARAEDAAHRHQLEEALAKESALRQRVETALVKSEAARGEAGREHATQVTAAREEIDRLQSGFTRERADLETARKALEADLARLRGEHAALQQTLEQTRTTARAALERAGAEHAAERTSLTAAVADRDAQVRDLEARLRHSDDAAARTREEADRAREEANRARDAAERQHAEELADAAARLADYQRRAAAEMAQAAEAATLALRAAEERAEADRRMAAEQAAARQTSFEAALAKATAGREAVELALAKEAASREAVEQALANESATRQTLDADLAALRGEHAALQQTLDETRTTARAALEHAGAEHAAERTSLTAAVADRDAQVRDLEARLRHSEEAAARAHEEANRARDAAERQHAEELADHQRRAAAEMAQAAEAAALALRAAEERAEADRRMAAEQAAARQTSFEAALAKATAGREAVELALAKETASREAVEQALANESATSQTLDADLAALRGEHAALEQTLDEARTTAQAALERAAAEHAAERTSLIAAVAERDTQLRDQADRHRAAEQAAAQALRASEERAETDRRTAAEQAAARQASFDGALARETASREAVEQLLANESATRRTLEADLAALRAEHTALQQTLEQTRATAQAVLERASAEHAAERTSLIATVAERDAQLRDEAARHRDAAEAADLALADSRRHFDRATVGMARWNRDRSTMHVNDALADLLGYETVEELESVDFASRVFESREELPWLVERCVASGATESIDTTWVKKDGARLIVRVQAKPADSGTILLGVHDITTLRVVEEKLRRSQRMESVARYASEVAATCDNLLRQVQLEGQQWLVTLDSDGARYQGQLLLDEVTRAAAFLRQLAVYGNEQQNAAELVEVNEVLRDLEPVLGRVAGGHIDLVLPKRSTPLNLDVDLERLERILVNVAAYGRERMPSGGRLMIEVAPVSVDRAFVEKHPNVRPGAHVLLTVTDVRRTTNVDGVTRDPRASAEGVTLEHPGVDLGALQALVSDCGGHLWMSAEPPGDMVLKIHLPRRVLDSRDASVPLKQPILARWISRVSGIQH